MFIIYNYMFILRRMDLKDSTKINSVKQYNIGPKWTKLGPHCQHKVILGDPGTVSRVDKMSVVKVYCKIETSPWALTLTEPVPEAKILVLSNELIKVELPPWKI